MNNEEYAKEFDAVVASYDATESPKVRLAVLEHLVRLADSAGDIVTAYNVRMEMIQCATFAGHKDKALVAFTWCLAQMDKSPDTFDIHSLLWKYKWILGSMATFVGVKKEKILALESDMQQRLLAAGYNLRPIQFLCCTNAMSMGDFDRASEFMEKWRETPRDEMADCEACEQNKLAEFLGQTGKPEESAEVAAKLLDGRMTCATIPHVTCGHMIATYLKLGRLDELQRNHSRWYKMVKDNKNYLDVVSQLMMFMTGVGRLPDAIAMFERHAEWAVETVNDHKRFMFYLAAGFLFQRTLASESHLRLKVPGGFEFKRDDAQYRCAELAQWFRTETESLAKRFNQRNGNEYYSKLMAEPEALFS